MNRHIYIYTDIFVVILVVLFGLFVHTALSAVKSVDKSPVILPTDSSNVRVSLFENHEPTTLRIQSSVGTWSVKLYPTTPASAADSIATSTENTTIPENEDLVIMLTSKGITAKDSCGREFETGYSKVEIFGGELMLVEMPNNQPILLRGKLEIILGMGVLRFVNEIALRDYLISSISELSKSPEPEAIKAILIAARSRVLRIMMERRHAIDAVDVCDKPHCMAFSGESVKRDLVAIMAEQCRNEVMCYEGKPIFAHFQDTCGGKISSYKDIYGLEDIHHQLLEDRLDSKGSENCFHSPSFSWTREFSQEEMSDFLSLTFAGGNERIFLRWDPTKVDPAGRITEVILRGKREKRLSGIAFLEAIQQHFGPNSVKSMRITLEPMRRATIYRGSGFGAGVGMCLFGADGLAKKGLDAYRILKFYYRNFEFYKDGKSFIPTPTASTDNH